MFDYAAVVNLSRHAKAWELDKRQFMGWIGPWPIFEDAVRFIHPHDVPAIRKCRTRPEIANMHRLYVAFSGVASILKRKSGVRRCGHLVRVNPDTPSSFNLVGI